MLPDIFEKHASRNFGRSGFRSLKLEVFTNKRSIVWFQIYHAWIVSGGLCRSLFFLAKPKSICGTSVLMMERPRSKDMRVWLKLSTSSRSIEIERDRATQHVLGTDFTYEDFRFWYPTAELELDSLEELTPTVPKRRTFSARRDYGADGLSRITLSFDEASYSLMSYDVYSGSSAAPHRSFEVLTWRNFDGIFSPTRMVISRGGLTYLSVMTLQGITFSEEIDAALFDLGGLAELHDKNFESMLGSMQPLA